MHVAAHVAPMVPQMMSGIFDNLRSDGLRLGFRDAHRCVTTGPLGTPSQMAHLG